MSLTGNLEDLPLLDILQIVSFSKKTGYLTIRAEEGEGGIVFLDGLVVAAFTWDSLPVDARFATLTEGAKGKAIRARIEIALEQLIRLREGQFNFNLTGAPPKVVGPRDIALETLDYGINPQELLLELARGMDEDRRDSTAAVEASFAEPGDESAHLDDPVAAEVAASMEAAAHMPFPPDYEEGATIPLPAVRTLPTPMEAAVARSAKVEAEAAAEAEDPASIRTVLLVDDEDDVRRLVADRFRAEGYVVVEAGDPESGVKQGARLGKEQMPFLLVADLGMPTTGGTSFQGGFELVKRLAKMNLRPPVLLMTESLKASLHLRAKQMGISSFVFKPGLSKLNPKQFESDMQAFATKLLSDVLPRLTRPTLARPQAPRTAGTAGAGPERAEPSAGEMAEQMSLLQRRLMELRTPQDANQIAMLVMKVAREFFERSILFLIKNEEARGLGGFGSAPKGLNLNLLAREVTIPLGEPSAFREAVTSGRPFSGALPDGKWSKHLMGKIGRFQSNAVALLPLVTHRESIAVLYGDNPETGSDFRGIDVLEVFVDQAGVALENAFLQRKLQALSGRT
jgi:CheY-like chemotaxis protein